MRYQQHRRPVQQAVSAYRPSQTATRYMNVRLLAELEVRAFLSKATWRSRGTFTCSKGTADDLIHKMNHPTFSSSGEVC
jgi:hypothetical protein